MICVFLFPALNRLVGLGTRHQPSAPATIDSAAFRDAMARTVQGIGIVTTDGPGGRFGITVSSVVSASAEPPLVMTCIHQRSPAVAAILRNGSFCVNLLAGQHRTLADIFAGRPEEGAPYDFGSATWIEGERGSPVLQDAVASLECVVHRTGRAGTHRVILGRCVHVATSDGPALLYSDRRYGIPLTWPHADPKAQGGENRPVTPVISAPVHPVGMTRARSLSRGRRVV